MLLHVHGAWKRVLPLFAEDFLYVADLLLNFTARFVRGSAIFRLCIAGRSPRLFLHRAFGLVKFPFQFVFVARVHVPDSQVDILKAVPD